MQSHETTSTETRHGQSRCAGLIALNAVLLGVLAFVALAPHVEAQQARPRGEYLMVGGRVNGVVGSAVYIIDSRNQEMVAVSLNNDTKALEGIGHRNLAQDATTLPGARRN